MISYLIDTDWIIDFLKGKRKVGEKLASLSDKGLAISVISLAELYEGIYGSNNLEQHLTGLNDFLKGVAVLGINDEVAKIFGQQRAKLRKEGKLLDNFDLLIAATCLHYDLRLITNNIKHFDRIEGLTIEG